MRNSCLALENATRESESPTCPPGPELRENDSSTEPRGTEDPLNLSTHVLASSISSGVSNDVMRGGGGRPALGGLGDEA